MGTFTGNLGAGLLQGGSDERQSKGKPSKTGFSVPNPSTRLKQLEEQLVESPYSMSSLIQDYTSDYVSGQIDSLNASLAAIFGMTSTSSTGRDSSNPISSNSNKRSSTSSNSSNFWKPETRSQTEKSAVHRDLQSRNQRHVEDRPLISLESHLGESAFLRDVGSFIQGFTHTTISGSYELLRGMSEMGVMSPTFIPKFTEMLMGDISQLYSGELSSRSSYIRGAMKDSISQEWNTLRYGTGQERSYMMGQALSFGMPVGFGIPKAVSSVAAELGRMSMSVAKNLELDVQYRTALMLSENVGYNVSPESWFHEFPAIGEKGTYITDYRAISDILGPVKPNTKFDVGLFSHGDTMSYFKVGKLEQALGLEHNYLIRSGFRFSQVTGITNLHPRSPITGNDFFSGPSRGLPGGGPELTIDQMPTRLWPWK